MKYSAIAFLITGIAAGGCGGGGADEVGESSEDTTVEGKDSSLCKVPKATFEVTAKADANSLSAGCPEDFDGFRRTYALDGTLASFVSSVCTGSARWKPGSQCVVEVEETCPIGALKSEIDFSDDQKTLTGSYLNNTESRCGFQARLTGTRSTANAAAPQPKPTTETKPTTVATPNRQNRLDLQIRFEAALDLGSGTWVGYTRLRLHSDGTFEKCEFHEVSGGVQATEATRSNGSYALVDDKLTLTPRSGERRTVTFTYSPGEDEARYGGKAWIVEKPGGELCGRPSR